MYAVEKKPRLIPDARSKRCIEIPRERSVLRSVCSAWIFIRPIAMPSPNNARPLCAPFRQHVKFNRVRNCEFHWGCTYIPWLHIRIPNITFFYNAHKYRRLFFYLRVVQGDSIFVNARFVYSEIPRDRIARNSFFLSTKISEALIVFEFSKATKNKSISECSYKDYIIYTYHDS